MKLELIKDPLISSFKYVYSDNIALYGRSGNIGRFFIYNIHRLCRFSLFNSFILIPLRNAQVNNITIRYPRFPYFYTQSISWRVDTDSLYHAEISRLDNTMNDTHEEFFQRCVLLSLRYETLVKIPSAAHFTNMISAGIFSTILIIPTILLNGISVFTIKKCPQLREKIAYFLIMAQSLTDLTVGCVGLPLMSYLCFSQALEAANCFWRRFMVRFMIFPFSLSLITLAAMSIERYMSIVHPVKHRNMVTKRKITVFLVGGCLFMLIAMVALTFLQSKLLYSFLISCMVLFLLLVIFVYTKIFFAFQKQNSPRSIADTSATNGQTKRLLLKKIQQAKSCFLAVGCFFGCFIAGICLLSSWSYVDKVHFTALRAWAGAIMNLNSSLNSVIFFWTRPLLRNETFKILKNMLAKQKF